MRISNKTDAREYAPRNYVMDLVIAAIDHEKKAGRPLQAVVLSRINYDRLEKWLLDKGILTEEALTKTLSWKKVEIKRSETASTEDIRMEYRQFGPEGNHLEDNMKLFGMNSGNIDKVRKNAKK